VWLSAPTPCIMRPPLCHAFSLSWTCMSERNAYRGVYGTGDGGFGVLNCLPRKFPRHFCWPPFYSTFLSYFSHVQSNLTICSQRLKTITNAKQECSKICAPTIYDDLRAKQKECLQYSKSTIMRAYKKARLTENNWWVRSLRAKQTKSGQNNLNAWTIRYLRVNQQKKKKIR
jgi:hypothetical protein